VRRRIRRKRPGEREVLAHFEQQRCRSDDDAIAVAQGALVGESAGPHERTLRATQVSQHEFTGASFNHTMERGAGVIVEDQLIVGTQADARALGQLVGTTLVTSIEQDESPGDQA
jgi:hypothetical protein